MQADCLAPPREILLISDEPDKFMDHIANLETFAEFRVQGITEWHEAAQELAKNTFDIVIVDYHICEAGGDTVCNYLRRYDSSIPIIVFANEFSKTGLVLCLNSGANDYVTITDDPAVISARVRAQIRARLREGSQRVRIGKFWLMRDDRVLAGVDDNKSVALTKRETDLLYYLAQFPNKSIGIDELYLNVWNYKGPASSHTVQTHIYRIRKKLEEDPSNPTFLRSTPSGYCLVIT